MKKPDGYVGKNWRKRPRAHFYVYTRPWEDRKPVCLVAPTLLDWTSEVREFLCDLASKEYDSKMKVKAKSLLMALSDVAEKEIK